MVNRDTLHSALGDTALAQIEVRLAARGIRLSESRRSVLSLLLKAEKPIGAYNLMERLRATNGHTVAPPTVYRALNFLISQGLVHRIERLDAFAICSEVTKGRGTHTHGCQFLICHCCGTALEMSEGSVTQALSQAANRSGFAVGHAVVEVEGVCASCRRTSAVEMLPPPDKVPA